MTKTLTGRIAFTIFCFGFHHKEIIVQTGTIACRKTATRFIVIRHRDHLQFDLKTGRALTHRHRVNYHCRVDPAAFVEVKAEV